MHPLLLHNGKIRSSTDACLNPGQVGLLNGWGVFSTLRVTDGVLFGYERHWARMKRDAALLRVPFPDSAPELEAQLLQLVEANQAQNATLRVSIVRNKGGQFDAPGIDRPFDIIAFTKELADWGNSVRLDSVAKVRIADQMFAGTKMLSWSFNLILLEQARERGFDEVVLINERGRVSECTSANIFAVFGDYVITPPTSSGCLPGVTRAILLEEIRVPGITLSERTLTTSDLEEADEVFITSTTRDLLRVSHIEGLTLKEKDPVVTPRLLEAFRSYRDDYVAQRKLEPTVK